MEWTVFHSKGFVYKTCHVPTGRKLAFAQIVGATWTRMGLRLLSVSIRRLRAKRAGAGRAMGRVKCRISYYSKGFK